MTQYPKIQTVFLRDPKTNYKTLLEEEWAKKEFEYLQDLDWIWTEKIDGTNIRIIWNGEKVRFGGKTDNAQIPTFLLAVLQDTFTVEKLTEVFPKPELEEGEDPEESEICLYGEGYGAKIQKGGNYLSDRTDFILFDCKIGDWWLTRESCKEIAENLSIKIVPVIDIAPLLDAVEFCKVGFKSTIAENKDYDAEGLVLKPYVDLFDRSGQRVITKIKTKDFRR